MGASPPRLLSFGGCSSPYLVEVDDALPPFFNLKAVVSSWFFYSDVSAVGLLLALVIFAGSYCANLIGACCRCGRLSSVVCHLSQLFLVTVCFSLHVQLAGWRCRG
jgi:hypothetical protein